MFLKSIGYKALLGAAALGLALGTAGSSEAKNKPDAMAALASKPILCLPSNAPVCGVKGGHRFTYRSACFASRDGAKVVSQSACGKVRVAKKADKKMDKMDKMESKSKKMDKMDKK